MPAVTKIAKPRPRQWLEVEDPAHRRPIAEVPRGRAEDVARAVKAAAERRARRRAEWQLRPGARIKATVELWRGPAWPDIRRA